MQGPATVRVRNDVRGKESLQSRKIAFLGGDDKSIEETFLFPGVNGPATPIANMLARARYKLASVRFA